MLTCLFCKKMLIHRYGYKPKKFCNNICKCAYHNKLNNSPIAIYKALDACKICGKEFTEKEKRKGKRFCSSKCRSIDHRNKHHDKTTSIKTID